MYLVINKCVTAVKVSNFSGHYLRNRSTLDIGVLGYIGIIKHKEYSPEVWHIPPGTSCIYRPTMLGICLRILRNIRWYITHPCVRRTQNIRYAKYSDITATIPL